MKLKPITELKTADLLKIIEGNSRKISTLNYKNDTLDFLSTYGISQGEHRILIALIYDTYKLWSKIPISKRAFANELVRLFPHIKYGESNVYLIDKPREFFLEKNLKKKRNKIKTKSWLKHFQRFLEKYNIKSGSFYVKDIVLYNLYDKWVYKNGNKHPLTLNQFLKFCRLFFQTPKIKIIKSHEWFAIENSIKEYLTPELINLMQQK